MNKRLLVILGVFVGGFGLGYALTWLLVSNPAPQQASPPSPAVAAAAGEGAIPASAVPPGAGSGAVSGTVEVDPGGGAAPSTPPGDDGAGAGKDAGAGVPSDGGEPAAAGEPSDGGEPAAAGEPSDGGEPAAGAPSDGGEPAAAGEPSGGGEPAAGAPTGPWWEVCKDKTCVMDFGRVTGSVSLREGKIEDGAEVVWRDTFAKAERIGSVPAKDGLRVVLHGVGLQHKLPVAAWISFRDGGTELTGVMALNIGDKVIKMKPIAP